MKKIGLFVLVIIFLNIVSLTLRTPQVRAFDLGYHYQKIEDVATGFSHGAKKKLILGDMGIDIMSTWVDEVSKIASLPAAEFLDKMHFDNLFDFNAIQQQWNWLEDLFKKTIRDFLWNPPYDRDKALIMIGELLHAVEDFYSHSNWVEYWKSRNLGGLPIPTWEEAKNAASGPYADGWRNLNDSKAPNYDPTKLQTGAWPDDKPIDETKGQKHHKDMNHDNSDRPNFSDAFNLSERASSQMLDKIRAWVGLGSWNFLQQYDIPDGPYEWFLDKKIDTWILLAKAAGKWRPGENSIFQGIGWSLEDIFRKLVPDPYTLFDGALMGTDEYSYRINNTGTVNISQFNIALSQGGVASIINLVIPDKWTTSFVGDNVVFVTTVAPITPGSSQLFSIQANCSFIQNASLTINQETADSIGPGTPDEFDNESMSLIARALTITTTTGGTTNPLPRTYTYSAGTVVSVTAQPAVDYVFGHWELDGSNVGATNPISVTMNTNHTLRAVFAYSPPPPPPPPPGRGGVVISVDKLGLLAPYIGLAIAAMIGAVATTIYVRHVKRRKEKQ